MYVRWFSSSEAYGGIDALRFNLIGQKVIKMAPQCFSPTSHFKNLLKRVTCSTKISVQSEDSVSSLMWLLQIRLCTDFSFRCRLRGRSDCRLHIMGHTLWHTDRRGSTRGSLPETEVTTGQVMMEADGRVSNTHPADLACFYPNNHKCHVGTFSMLSVICACKVKLSSFLIQLVKKQLTAEEEPAYIQFSSPTEGFPL